MCAFNVHARYFSSASEEPLTHGEHDDGFDHDYFSNPAYAILSDVYV